ncbi:MAG TPA: helix-turn-helix domain-containing protein [Acholeplasmataceae bacterium]|nr:helix-turn-helix domain-containing protein [Acholeplasmataceae bacterium]
MARISHEEKERINHKIIEVSKRLFFEVGYDETSTKMIAKEVGIAEGTIFNYFPTKADIFFETIYDDIIRDQSLFPKDSLLTKNVIDVIWTHLYHAMSKIIKVPKIILKELAIAGLKMAKTNPKRFEKMAELDFKYMKELESYINILQDKHVLMKANAKTLSELVYSALVYELLMYLYDKDRDIEIMKTEMRNKIEHIITPYIKGEQS